MEQLSLGNFILAAIISSLTGMSLNYVFTQGEIFGALGNIVRRNVPEFWAKPLTECPVCMSFWWGALLHISLLQTYLPIAIIGSILSIGLSAFAVGFFNSDDEDN
jgi:ABC-type multidrug transport system permease subunit